MTDNPPTHDDAESEAERWTMARFSETYVPIHGPERDAFEAARGTAERQLHEARTQLEDAKRILGGDRDAWRDTYREQARRRESAEAQLERCQEALRVLHDSVERDLREPDKLLCHTLTARRHLPTSPNTGEAA